MQITKKLPQFERFPALFITCGEYEAHFYIAFKGKVNENKKIKMTPRDEAGEKQIFTGRRAGANHLLSMTHHGRYLEDLKMKFTREIHKTTHDILAKHHLEEIYIFAPKYVANRIMKGLDKNEQKKVRMQFYKEYTKSNPVKLIELFQKEIEEIHNSARKTPESDDLIGLTK